MRHETQEPLTFGGLQAEVAEWARRNFPDQSPGDCFEGMVEEMGELAHARLKARQGIRGDAARHEEAERDALGDILIYMADYCQRRGFAMQRIVEETWDHVSRRDWKANAIDGEVGR